jgi:hypothetical protein
LNKEERSEEDGDVERLNEGKCTRRYRNIVELERPEGVVEGRRSGGSESALHRVRTLL